MSLWTVWYERTRITMSKYVIVGAGQVGAALAKSLGAADHDVTVVTRSGSGPSLSGVQRVAADASDAEQLARIVDGAAVLFNCANPKYWRWPQDWPPMASAILSAAESTGAVLVTLCNVYGYGPVDGPMTEDLPLATTRKKGRVRVQMWHDALAAHEAGRARVAEVRASDYFGPGAGELSHFGARFIPRLLAGKPVQYIGDPDQPHSVTYIDDVVRALSTVAVDERAWGRAWHAPTNQAQTPRQLAEQVCKLAGVRSPRFRSTPAWTLKIGGLFSPLVRELPEVRYQFVKPFVLDSSAFETTFGVHPTPMDEALRSTIAWWRSQSS